MRIVRMKLTNYSGFADTGWIDFSAGINLVVGENNSGKSSLLQSFKPALDDNRHRRPERFTPERLVQPEQLIDCEISGPELETALLRRGNGTVYWPIRAPDADEADRAKTQLREYLKGGQSVWHLRRRGGTGFLISDLPSHGLFSEPARGALELVVSDGAAKPGGVLNSANDTIYVAMEVIWPESIFYFDAQRFNVGRSAPDRPPRLSSTADNLAAYLSRLQGESPDIFDKIVSHVREIFPTVQNLSVAPDNTRGPQQVEIRAWPTRAREQAALSFGLDSCGTGISQALAILTVATTMVDAVIVIDEIGSFLHPAAAKALLRIIQTYYAGNQYIISTHSGEIIAASAASTTHFVSREGFDSSVTKVDLANLDSLSNIASQLGISMTDVFAAERIIWVEGATEANCFPYIYKRTSPQLPNSTLFVGLVATGDILGDRPRPQLILDIYGRLSSLAAPLVKSVTFGFDTDDLSDTEKQDLTRQSRGRVKFLPRRNLESYLIDIPAISHVIASELRDLDPGEIVEAVDARLHANANDPAYKASSKWKEDLADPAWLSIVDGAKLITKVFAEVTENRLVFRKTRHSLMILQVIAETRPHDLEELDEYVADLVATSQPVPPAT